MWNVRPIKHVFSRPTVAGALRPGLVAAALLCCAAPAAGQLAYRALGQQPQSDAAEARELYRVVAHFDFDERKLGNYEDTPLHWIQLEGPGLPTLISRGRFDEQVGHDAPPSFRLDIQTRNVAYEYQHLDLTVVPHTDYVVTGYVKAQGLRYASAFVGAYFVDRFGDFIEGSQRISRLFKATGQQPEPWQEFRIQLPGEFPAAYALRLQLWILQDHTWRPPDPREIDPILRRDVYATAWFDDIRVYLLPRVKLDFSDPARLVRPGRSEYFVVDINNATADPLRAELSIVDRTGRLVHREPVKVPAREGPLTVMPPETRDGYALAADRETTPRVRLPVPSLNPGHYTATLRLLGGAGALLQRVVSFDVLPALPGSAQRYPDLGVDMGYTPPADIASLRELLDALGAGAVKVGVTMLGPIDSAEESSYIRHLSELLRIMAENRIESTGVILPPHADQPQGRFPVTVRKLVGSDDFWRHLLNPVLANLGGLVPTWQVGPEQLELAEPGGWTPREIELVRTELRRFITIPRLAIPQRLSAVQPTGEDVHAVWVAPDIPTRNLPRLMKFLSEDNPAKYWLTVAQPPEGSVDYRMNVRELARRLILCKALNPARVYVAAPFNLSRASGLTAFEPGREFIALRTLFHFLAGKRAVAAMQPADDSIAIVFEDMESSCLVIWTWRDRPLPRPVELYLGPGPVAYTIDGQRVPLTVRNKRTLLPVGPDPLIVTDLQPELVRLQASYNVSPRHIESHEADKGPVITFQNPYRQQLSGEILLTPPGNWQVEPAVIPFVLEPGEIFSQPLALALPPREIAKTHQLMVRMRLHSPDETELDFREPITIGLNGIVLNCRAWWEGDTLVVEQSLRNISSDPVSFSSYCEPPGRARVEGEFLDVAPGELAMQTYVFPNAADLAGVNIPTGVQEINGRRSLDQFAEAPPLEKR